MGRCIESGSEGEPLAPSRLVIVSSRLSSYTDHIIMIVTLYFKFLVDFIEFIERNISMSILISMLLYYYLLRKLSLTLSIKC